jgi:hypothetical protein
VWLDLEGAAQANQHNLHKALVFFYYSYAKKVLGGFAACKYLRLSFIISFSPCGFISEDHNLRYEHSTAM